MSKLRVLIPSVILPLTLVAGACNNKPETEANAPQSSASEPIALASLSRRDFEKALSVKTQAVKPASANAALEKLYLANPNSDKFTWGGKSGDKGQYSYTDVKVLSQSGHAISIDVLDLTNVRMEGGSAIFDKADMTGVTIQGDDSVLSIARLSLSDPSPEFSRSLMETIEKIDDMRNLRRLDLGLNLGTEGKTFGAVLIDNFQVELQGTGASFGTLGWREDAKTGNAAFLLDALEITTRDNPNEPEVIISVGSISGTGLDAKALRKLEAGKNSRSRFGFDLLSQYAPVTADIAVKNILVQSSTMSVKTEGVMSQSTRRGDSVQIRQALMPLTVAFTGQPSGTDAYRLWEGVKGAGYDDLLLSGSHTINVNSAAQTFDVSNGKLILKDGFNLAYSASGQAQNGETPDDMTITSLDFNLQDQSIVDRAFTYFALQQGRTPQKAKMQAKGALMLGGAAAAFMAPTAEEQASITQTVNSLAAFIDKGGELQVSLRPNPPLTLDTMKNIDPLTVSPKQFGLTVKHVK